MAQSGEFRIRSFKGMDELVMAEDLQRDVWRMEVDTPIAPASILSPISKNGGVVYGAFDGEALVGLVVSFMGRTPDGRLLHWSHLNGVRTEAEGHGLGEKLKWAQREAVLAMDIDLIRWTVDPLEGRNATLNFEKLGVTCRTYARNVYGNMQDAINRGIESDRFIVDWEIDSERVKKRLTRDSAVLTLADLEGSREHAQRAQYANPTRIEAKGVRSIIELRLELNTSRVIVEIPDSYQKVKVYDHQLAVAWREEMRQLFEVYFKRGYVVTAFVSERQDGERRNFYLLELAAES